MVYMNENGIRIYIVVPDVPLGLNQLNRGKSWQWRVHRKKQIQHKWYWLIRKWCREHSKDEELWLKKVKSPELRLVIWWKDKRRIKDEDNLIGGFKCILDVLVSLGLLIDDDPKHLKWDKVDQRIGKPEQTEIILTERK